MVNSFVVGLFLFFEPVTICHSLKKCTCYGIIVNMKKGCVKGPASFLKIASLNRADFYFSSFYCLTPGMTHNQVEM